MDKTSLQALLQKRTPRRLNGSRKAAVLIPILFTSSGARILFMKRPDSMRSHAGQVSFPGGRVEPEDASIEATALREAQEELGLQGAEVIGTLDDINTYGSNIDVTPVVGAFFAEPAITPSPVEVDTYFWVEAKDLARLDEWRGAGRLWFYERAPHTIWGATAAITRQLMELWVDTL